MGAYGDFGGPNKLIEAYIEWRDQKLELLAIGELEEADSKADFAEFLYGPVRTAVWHGYQRIQPQYRKYARIESAPDFRERRLKGLNALKGIGYVGDHGEYPGMVRTTRPAALLVVDTYGGVYAITRQAIRNDDSGELLNRNPADMGFAMGNFVAETLVALIESNPTAPDGQPFFSVGRGNQVTVALSEDSLADAITFMESQLDDDGYRILIRANALIVKSARMELIARRILNSAQTGANIQYTGGTAGAGTTLFDKGTDNPLQNILPNDAVVREPFFSDANDWYLFANPADVPAFALGFLDGNEQPFVGLKDPMVRNALGPGMDPYTYELDSIDFKVRHDFGCAPVDPRGAYRGVVA
jgi:hypothetical protein